MNVRILKVWWKPNSLMEPQEIPFTPETARMLQEMRKHWPIFFIDLIVWRENVK